MLEVFMLFATVALVLITITGYDRYFATKLKLKLANVNRDASPTYNSSINMDSYTKMKIKKVKASKIGNYLIVTLLISESNDSKGEDVEIDNPLVLTLFGEDEKSVEPSTS